MSDQSDEQIAESTGLTAGQVQQLKAARGFSAATLTRLPQPVVRRAVRRLEYPDLPRLRAAFRLRQSRDEHGVVPPNALGRALRQLRSTRAKVAAKPRVAGIPSGRTVDVRALMAPPPTAGLHPDHSGWISLGPGNIGGRTRSIVIHPTTPNTMWAGSVGGGVWRTDDGGGSWNPVDDFMANLAVSCMAMDPSNSKVIYAGTGEGFFNVDAIRGAGIFRTTDGATWKQLSATATADFRAVNRLAVSKNGKTVLAATPTGIFRSIDTARATWTHTLTDGIADIKFHPTSTLKAVAGGLDNGRAYYSTNGGKTWKVASSAGPWSGRVELTYAAHDPAIVYASVQLTSGEIWRSSDGGKTYTRKTGRGPDGEPANYLGDQGWYDNVVWAGDPTNAELVIAGGIDLWKSTDGGDTLVDISTWWDPRSAHADQHCIVTHPGFNGTSNKSVFFGNDGGIFKTVDVYVVGADATPPRIRGWSELDNTYGVTQFYGAAGNPTTGAIIGGAQDNGTLRYTSAGGTEKWTEMFGGDGGWCAADPSDPNVFYGEYVYLNICRSTDGGATADYISGQYWNGHDWLWKAVPYRIPDAKSNQALFIAPFILDPNNPSRLLAGGVSLWRTSNAKTANTDTTGPAWAPVKPSIGSRISAITVAVSQSDIIWVGHEKGEVYKTTNGTTTSPAWQKVDHVGSSPLSVSRYCTSITIDPKAISTVYVTYGGYTKGNVWKTTDGGQKWKNIGDVLPEAPVRALAIHPKNSKFLYLGTEVGLFSSEDAGTTWSPANEGPTNCSVDSLFWMGTTLVCATHGRGMFKINLPVGP